MQEPVTVHQDDHFGNAHVSLSCTAAPIFDSLGGLAAVLDISLLRSPTPKRSQNLPISLVTNAARRVEMANLMAKGRRDWVLRLSDRPEFLDVDPEAAVRLDGSGRVLGYTRGARHLFPDGSIILGRRIDDVLGLTVDDLPDLMRDRPTEDRIIEMRDGGALFGHAIAPQAPRIAPRSSRRGGPLTGLAGDDPAMEQVLARAAKLARTDVPLLITGETGTGKTRLARAIHMVGTASGFLSIDCAGLSAKALQETCADVNNPTTLLLRRRAPDDMRLSPSARAALLGRRWPGNLRELEQVLDVAIGLCEGRVIDQSDLPLPVDAVAQAAGSEESLEQVMEACGWNMSCAARRLGVNRSTVLRRLRRAGLQPPDYVVARRCVCNMPHCSGRFSGLHAYLLMDRAAHCPRYSPCSEEETQCWTQR